MLRCIGRATTSPVNAPTTLDVAVEEDTKQAEGSQPAKEAYAKPTRLPIAVSIIVIFIEEYYKKNF